MLHLILGGCGTGKSAHLIDCLRHTIAAGKKAAVLLPDQFGFEGERKLCKALGTQQFNQIETFTFQSLSREILTHGDSTLSVTYASDQEKLVYLSLAAQQCESQKLLGLLGRRVGSSDFILSLSQLVTKFRKAGVSGEQLITAAASFPDRLAQKSQDIGHILLAYDRILTERGRSDSLVNLTAAAQLAVDTQFFGARSFFIDEFDSFTGDQYRLLSVMLSQCPDVTAAIRCDNPSQRPTGIFLGGNQTAFRLRRMAEECQLPTQQDYFGTYRRSRREDLAAVGTQVFRVHTKVSGYHGNVHIARASDPAAEVDYICAQICELLANDKELRCRDITIAVKQPDVYNSLLSRAMVRYGLPFDTTEARSILYTDLIRHLLCVFELLRGRSWDTELLLRYVKTPFSGYYSDTAAMLEHFCFTWGIARKDWEQPFWVADDPQHSPAEGFGGEALEKLRVRLTKEITALREACSGKSVRVVCYEVFSHLSRKKKAFQQTLSEMDPIRQKDFVMIWNLLCDILDTLVTCYDQRVLSMRQLYDQVLLLVQSSSFSVPPQKLDSIHIVDAQTARLNDPKILFIPGVIDGVLPGDVAAGGMFTQQELRTLEDHEITVSRLLPELHSDELMIAVRLLCAPSEQVFLTCPQTSAEGETCAPSPLLSEIQDMFPPGTPLTTDVNALPLTFFVRSPESAYDTYVRRMHDTPSGELSALRSLLMEDSVYAARIRKLESEQEEPRTNPDTIQKLLGMPMVLSPSGIECYYQCAFQYFCRYLLRLYVPEKITLSAQNIGNFAHYCLEQILRDTPMETFLTLDRNALSALINGYAKRFSEVSFSETLRRSGRFQMNYHSAGSSLLELLVQMQNVFRDEKFRPAGYEVSISPEPKEGEFPALSLGNGSILCRGKIDRVDLYMDEMTRLLRVVDYKTGDKSLQPLKLGYGLDMQMLIYLFTLTQSGAFGGAEPSGVLYLPSGQLRQKDYEARSVSSRAREEILGDYYRSRGLLLESAAQFMDPRIRESAKPVRMAKDKDTLFTVTQEQMEHLGEHVRSAICNMADHLRAGEIAPVPRRFQQDSPCTYCAFSDLCGKADVTSLSLTKEEKNAALDTAFGKEEPDDAEMDESAEASH